VPEPLPPLPPVLPLPDPLVPVVPLLPLPEVPLVPLAVVPVPELGLDVVVVPLREIKPMASTNVAAKEASPKSTFLLRW